MSNATDATAETIKYSPGHIVYLQDRSYGPVTITEIVSTTWPPGYAGTFSTNYNGKIITTKLGWIPQSLIRGFA